MFLGDGHYLGFSSGFHGEVGVAVRRFGGGGGGDGYRPVSVAGSCVGGTPGTFVCDGPAGVAGDGEFLFAALGFK